MKHKKMTEYAPELLADLFEHIAEGRSAKSFCRERHISFSRLLEWINDDPERRDRYHLARWHCHVN